MARQIPEKPCKQEYVRINMIKQDICILDSDHITMDPKEFKDHVNNELKKIRKSETYEETKVCWARYFQAISWARDKCPYINRDDLKDKTKQLWYIPNNVGKDFELVPGDSFGKKARCLYPNKYKE